MKAVVVAWGILIAALIAGAQPPDSLWSRTFGGTQIDQAYCVRQTTDGGYILAGWTQSSGAGSYDLWLIKTDTNGNSVWTRTLGGSGEDRGASVVEVADGYVAAGRTSSFPAGNENLWLVKVNLTGDSVWSHVYGGTGPERAYSVQQTADGGLVVAGNSGTGTTSDFWMIKTDANGDSTWSRRYGTANVEDWCNSVRQTDDGGYVLGGYTASPSMNMWMVKTNENGDSLWSRSFGGTSVETCRSIEQTTDGGYILGGNTSVSGSTDAWLVKTTASGDTLWTRRFGGTGTEECYWVQQTTDGGYVFTGYRNTNGDAWIVKTDADGDSLWSRTLGGTNGELTYSVQQTSDGGYVLAGYTLSFGAGSNDAWLVKLGATTPQPGIAVSPTQLSFGDVAVGDSAILSLTIRSIGQANLNVTAITTPPDFHAAFQDPISLPPGDSLTVPVTFAPTQAMAYVDTLRVISDAPTSPTAVRMTGTGTAAGEPGIMVVPMALSFGPVPIGDNATLPLRIISAGTSALIVTNLETPPDFSTDFVPPQTLPPGDTLVVAVTFAPTNVGAYDDTLHILSNIPGGPVDVRMTGTGLIDAAGDVPSVPREYALAVYPNPFNAVAMISFDLPTGGWVSLKLYDLLGRDVQTLSDGVRPAGRYSVSFDGQDLASGIYLCKIEAGSYSAVRKVVLIK